jgi:hypothetical protein
VTKIITFKINKKMLFVYRIKEFGELADVVNVTTVQHLKKLKLKRLQQFDYHFFINLF